MRRGRNRPDLAARLRELAAAIEAGRHPVPRLGIAPAGAAGGITVPPVIHDLLCGWRVRIRLDTDPPLVLCPGCGLTIPNPPGPQETTP